VKLIKCVLPPLMLTSLATHAADLASTSANPVVATEAGQVSGVTSNAVSSFKGIPFAAPPIGDLRWRPPQPAAHWQGVRTANTYGNDCMQKPIASDAAPLGAAPAEDCLYLNVWKPSAVAGKRPVLVWIYGGGFMNGGASPPVYSGDQLAEKDVVVVSFNYRVGRFGFFAHPQLTKEQSSTEAVGNYGFMDQVAALQWVKRNIASFGGDPDNVTIVGESAGGMSIHTLLTSSLSQSLFQKAVIQSGGDGHLMMNSLANAQKAGQAFAASQGIAANDAHALQKLRQLPAEQIMGDLNMNTLFQKPSANPTFTMPMIDGQVAVDAMNAYSTGHFAHVPIMVGATSDDLFGERGPMVQGAKSIADLLASQGVPLYRYRFSYVAESEQAANPNGAKHASDIPYFFGTLAQRYGAKTTPRDQALSALTSDYLINFVKTGNPNASGLPQWSAYQPGRHSSLEFTGQGTAATFQD